MLSEVLAGLAPRLGENYLDLTAGYAGHARQILDVTQNYKESVLIDRDEFAINYLRGKYRSEPVEIVKSDFYSAALQLIECGKTFDMILADFGVSSPQLDNGERGFAFMKDGPLDMRMDQSEELTASEIVNKWRERELAEIFEKYGEETAGLASKHARLIAGGRPWRSTKQLAEAIAKGSGHSRRHPATQVFQAIRISVNDELGLIERTLPLLVKLMKPKARLALITFHSLEDRMVKRFFKEQSEMGEESALKIMTKSPKQAEESEVVINPRARSAKLRIAMKLG